jgi:quaternary ammonium compound-resistance protein SugE
VVWLVLLVSAIFEAIWATALGRSSGFTQVLPTVVFLFALLVSMLGLGWAAKHIQIGTAYAVWTGIGAALTVGYAILSGEEAASAWKIVFITGVIAAVVGLKLLPNQNPIGEHTGRGVPVATGRRSGLTDA